MPRRVATDSSESVPLATADFQILLALCDGPRHGHAIRIDLALRTGGEVIMGPGTLYGALKRMLNRHWIAESGPPDPRDHDERRRYYCLTPLGRDLALGEARRLVRLLCYARSQGLNLDVDERRP